MEAKTVTPILLIADHLPALPLLDGYLSGHGFSLTATTFEQAMAALASRHYAAIVLELRLFGAAPLALLERLRAESHVPILALAGSADAAAHLSTLDLGATAYLPRDSTPHELLATLRRVVLMGEPAAAGHRVVRVRDLLLDVDTRRALLGSNVIDLSPAEFTLLLTLAEAPGRLFTREQLAALMNVNPPAVDVHVSAVRRKLRDPVRAPRWIATVRGEGYRLPAAAFRATSSR